MKRLLAAIGAIAVLVAVLAVGVLPTRTYLDQRRQLEQAQQRVRLLDLENQRLAARVEKLHSDTEIERLAREQYNLVRPGEEAFALLPSADDAPPPSPRAVPGADRQRDTGTWQRVKDLLTFWG